ncbi:MAG: hypothetical protein NXI32_01210 [bacterium]|nr:hypothetical protein [bacterium]
MTHWISIELDAWLAIHHAWTPAVMLGWAGLQEISGKLPMSQIAQWIQATSGFDFSRSRAIWFGLYISKGNLLSQGQSMPAFA